MALHDSKSLTMAEFDIMWLSGWVNRGREQKSDKCGW